MRPTHGRWAPSSTSCSRVRCAAAHAVHAVLGYTAHCAVCISLQQCNSAERGAQFIAHTQDKLTCLPACLFIAGFPPFWGSSDPAVFHRILNKPVDFEYQPWPLLSAAAKDFVARLLDKDPARRATAAQALTHPWITDQASDVPLSTGTRRAPVGCWSVHHNAATCSPAAYPPHLPACLISACLLQLLPLLQTSSLACRALRIRTG